MFGFFFKSFSTHDFNVKVNATHTSNVSHRRYSINNVGHKVIQACTRYYLWPWPLDDDFLELKY